MTSEWKYESADGECDSTLQCRIFFLESIQRWKPHIVTVLSSTAFPKFVLFTEQFFKKQPQIKGGLLHDWPDSLRLLRQIPSEEVRVLSWEILRGMICGRELQGSEDFCTRLRAWASVSQLTAGWCYEFAMEVMISWLYTEHIWWEGPRAEPLKLRKGGVVTWTEVLHKLKFDLEASRIFLSYEILPNEPPPFLFESWFKSPGWNYLDQGKGQWKADLEKQFKHALLQRSIRGEYVPKPAISLFNQTVRIYLTEQDRIRRETIERFRLIKRPRFYAIERSRKDAFDWLVKYQILDYWDCGEISREANVGTEIVRKAIAEAAAKIGLKLRPALKRGRPVGIKEEQPRRREIRRDLRMRKSTLKKIF